MANYVARVMHGTTGGSRAYEFEAEEGLMGQTPARVIRRFTGHVGTELIPTAYRDYELNAAFKNDALQVVTAWDRSSWRTIHPSRFSS